MDLTVRLSLLCVSLYLLTYEQLFAQGDKSDVKPEYLDMLLNKSQYDEFSKLMRIEDSSIVRPASGVSTPILLVYNDTIKGKIQGDILLRRWQQSVIRKGFSFAERGISKWRNYIPYAISENYSQRSRKVIEDIISYINGEVQNILVPYNAEREYVFIFPGAGFNRNLGRVGGPQALSLCDFGDFIIPFALHPMGHTVGMEHKQIRPDRDEHIHIIHQNIPKSMKTQYDKAKAKDVLIIAPYDLYSVMHYSVLLLGSNATAIEVLQKNVNISRVGQSLY